MAAIAGALAKVLEKVGPKLGNIIANQARGGIHSLVSGYGQSLQQSTTEPPKGLDEAGRVAWRQKQRQDRLQGISLQNQAPQLGEMAGQVGQIAGQVNPFNKDTAMGAAGGALRGIGSIAGMFGPKGMMVEGVLKFTASLLESVDKVRNWGNQLHEANMRFAEVSGSMAQLQAVTETQAFYLQQSQGETRASSAAYLSAGKMEMDKVMAPIENLWAKVENYIGGTVMLALSAILKPLSQLAEWLGGGEADVSDQINASRWTAEMAREADEQVRNRPANMR